MKTLSDKYKIIETGDLVQRIRNFAGNVEIKSRQRWNKSAIISSRHVVEARLMDVPCTEGFPTIYVENSYDGCCALTVRVGLYRLICSNGLVVGKDFFCQRIIHRKGDKVEQFLEDFDKILIAAVQKIRDHLEVTVQKLKDTPVTYGMQLATIEALPLPAKTKEVAKELRTRPVRAEDCASTAWSLYNSINEAIKIRSRSGLADYRKNDTLMEEVLKLAA